MFAGMLSMFIGMLIMLLGLPFAAMTSLFKSAGQMCLNFAYEMRPEESEE